jgi:hypothetical protein
MHSAPPDAPNTGQLYLKNTTTDASGTSTNWHGGDLACGGSLYHDAKRNQWLPGGLLHR